MRITRKRVHGFLVRMRTTGGRNIINRRRQKGRKLLSICFMRKGHRIG